MPRTNPHGFLRLDRSGGAEYVGFMTPVLRSWIYLNCGSQLWGSVHRNASGRNRRSRRVDTLIAFIASRTGQAAMRILSIITLMPLLICGCAGPFEMRKTKWSVPEVRDWYADYRRIEPHAWDGILYEGSDGRWHHFVARVLSVDNWAIIQIKKEDLTLVDERPNLTISNGALGYYYVDPSRDFMKLRDY